MTCVGPKAGDADLWIKICEELRLLMSKEILVEVKHVKRRNNAGRWVYSGSESKDNAAGARRGVRSPVVCSELSLFGGGIGRTEDNSTRSQKKSGSSWTRKERKRSIERSGVP